MGCDGDPGNAAGNHSHDPDDENRNHYVADLTQVLLARRLHWLRVRRRGRCCLLNAHLTPPIQHLHIRLSALRRGLRPSAANLSVADACSTGTQSPVPNAVDARPSRTPIALVESMGTRSALILLASPSLSARRRDSGPAEDLSSGYPLRRSCYREKGACLRPQACKGERAAFGMNGRPRTVRPNRRIAATDRRDGL
jgi:hypothetical protein